MTRHASDSSLPVVPATAARHGGDGERARPPTPQTAAPPLDRETRRRIGRNLRLLYADVLNQPLPDRFTALLDGLSSPSDSRESS